ncbi:MAG: septum formation protein Maf [Deltaproteobacteria bacterium]|nr:septum formation protein Maf [Deltaproteobacteria bacterium]
MIHPEIHENRPLILASASPRRKALLRQIGLPFRALPSGVDEQGSSGDPDDLAVRLSLRKAREVCLKAPGSWILGADTLVVVGRRVLGKPLDAEEARAMLRLLSGTEHRVVTGFCILDPEGNQAACRAVSTRVRFRVLETAEIKGYVASGEPFGKAGAYAIQGIGAFMVESISGSYTNVVGLPVCAVVSSLLAAGALQTFPLPTASG